MISNHSILKIKTLFPRFGFRISLNIFFEDFGIDLKINIIVLKKPLKIVKVK